MQFQNRDQFTKAAASEKITLVHIDAKARLYVFNGPTMDIYSKQVPYFVSGLKQNEQDLIKVENLASVVEGTFYYDIEGGTLYARFFSDESPQNVEIIATYRFFFADKGLTTSFDLENISEDVFYDGRFVSGPGYKHKIGIDQALTSLVGEGTLVLRNEDGGLDSVFDRFIFENQVVTIYSWNPQLDPNQAKVIYRGQVTNKSYNGERITFKVKDQIFNLLDSPNITAYDENDSVNESTQGQYKRRVYGRVDGLRCQSTDQVGDGVALTGTVQMLANSTQINGTGTSFLTEVLQNDTIIVGTQEFEVETVVNNTTIIATDEADFGFGGETALLIPERGTTNKNRTYLATGHICAEVTHQVVNALQFNRIILSDTDGLFSGDFIEFVETGERIEIKTVAPGNIVVLQQNVVLKPSVGTDVIRRPIQEVYIGNKRVNATDYAIFNTTTGAGLVFNDEAEFNLARPRNTVFQATFTNGSRNVTVANGEVSLQEIFQPGDFVRPDDVNYITYYKVVNVNSNSLDLTATFSEPTTTETIEIISPDYLDDDSTVSVNILGKTVDGTASGTWIQTVSQAQRDLIADINITAVNEQSFTDGFFESNQLVSMAIPESFTSKKLPKTKDLVDKLNKSVRSSLTLDNDLKIKFKTLNVYTAEDLVQIKDSDVLDWKLNSTNGKTFRRALTKYRFTDVDLITLEEGNKFLSYESEFVRRYIGTNKVDELDLYLYKERDAKIMAHRHLYYNRLGLTTLKITTDLRLENVEIGDVVIADFQRLYKRFGSAQHRKKTMLVVGKTINGTSIQLELNDLGNTFNTSSFITPNDAPEYNLATEDQKLIHGYITDNQGITEDDEDSAGIHLIS